MIYDDALKIFRESRTPCGLYARERWLGEGGSSRFRKDFEKTVSDLKEGQWVDGSWKGSILETVRRLFGLHVTVRDECHEAERGLDWLRSASGRISKIYQLDNNATIDASSLRGLPFVKGEASRFALGAWLFLSTIFGRSEDPDVIATYSMFERMGARDIESWGGMASMSNILRAFVVHPTYSRKRAVSAAVKKLERLQLKDGTWPRPIPFFHTINALSHLEGRQAVYISGKAFSYADTHRNKDGTWGASDREWKTFLIVHAMKRRGML
jgi:hypothetical protein